MKNRPDVVARSLLRKFLSFIPGKNNQGSTFVVAALLSLTLWFLVTINQEYDTSIAYPVKITAVPETIEITRNLNPMVDVVARGGGVDLLVEHFKLHRDTLEFPFSEDYRKNNFIPTGPYKDGFARIIPHDIITISPGRIYFEYEKKIYKRVPLRLRTRIQLKPTYQLREQPQLLQDSVIILGPQTRLDSIHEWFTADEKTEMISTAGEIEVNVLNTVPGLSVSPRKVRVSVNPILYTQALIHIPIELTDLPEGINVRLSHTFLDVAALIPMENFHQTKMESKKLRLPVSYHDLDPEIPYFIPQIELPEPMKRVSHTPQRLSYVIIKK
ncbi:MAG: hypothetical protein SF052_00365 [Bacteroidia bacterium]|nr:hypothetical protein [Bacteroidia bacterium]